MCLEVLEITIRDQLTSQTPRARADYSDLIMNIQGWKSECRQWSGVRWSGNTGIRKSSWERGELNTFSFSDGDEEKWHQNVLRDLDAKTKFVQGAM